MSFPEIEDLLAKEERIKAAEIIAAAHLKAAELIADAKLKAAVWKWIAGLLVAIIFSSATTYLATAKDYVVKSDFTELKAIVTRNAETQARNAEDLNRLIGQVNTHLAERK